MKLTITVTVLVFVVNFSAKFIMCYGQTQDKNVTVSVSRRLSADIYQLSQDNVSHHVCIRHATYMVEERKCIMNEVIFDGKLISTHIYACLWLCNFVTVLYRISM